MSPWIQTYSGVAFDLITPTVDMIKTVDIAHALANINRFTGHTVRPYSVGEHSRNVAEMLRADKVPRKVVLQGLLHDAAEAYVGDVSAPLKQVIGPGMAEVEHRVWRVIAERYGVEEVLDPRVHEADLRMVLTEARDLLSPKPKDWGIPFNPYPPGVLSITTRVVPSEVIEKRFWAWLDLLGAPL